MKAFNTVQWQASIPHLNPSTSILLFIIHCATVLKNNHKLFKYATSVRGRLKNQRGLLANEI